MDDNLATEFDRLIESARTNRASQPSREKSYVALPRSTVPVIPTKRPMPHLDRAPDLIPERIRLLLRGLISGAEKWPLLLTGKAGTGKTCAGLCLLDWAGGDYWRFAELH